MRCRAPREDLEEVGLVVTDENRTEYNDSVDKGATIGYTAAREEGELRPGDEVTLIESLGPKPIPVPEIADGTTLPDAIDILQNAGFTVTYDERWEPFLNAGLGGYLIVQSTDPTPGTEVVPGSTITVTASLGG